MAEAEQELDEVDSDGTRSRYRVAYLRALQTDTWRRWVRLKRDYLDLFGVCVGDRAGEEHTLSKQE